jgi:hypothetical protein
MILAVERYARLGSRAMGHPEARARRLLVPPYRSSALPAFLGDPAHVTAPSLRALYSTHAWAVNAIIRGGPGTGPEDSAAQTRVSGSRLVKLLDQYRRNIIRSLMGSVPLEDVHQENLCCVNTAVVMLVAADFAGTLARDLAAVRAMAGGPAALRNLAAVLPHWCRYYTPRGRDNVNLETGADVSFREWFRVAKLLEGPETCPQSLAFHLAGHELPAGSQEHGAGGEDPDDAVDEAALLVQGISLGNDGGTA